MKIDKKFIREIEIYGKDLFEYSINEDIVNEHYDDEPLYESVHAGDAVVYEYAGKRYEIITWNENSQKHKDGEKTILELNN
jgi:hypothetical protein